MSVNIKLGDKTISGVDSIRVEDADTAGSYDVFSVSIGYTVSFSSNNSIIQQVSVPVGGTVNEPDDPSAEGYSLVGWYTQSGGQGTAITFPYTPTADITLYAYYVAETFITFSSDESFSLGVYNKTKNWNGTLEYSTDKVNWTTWDGTTDVSAAKHRSGYYLSLRGSNNNKISLSTDNGRFIFAGSFIFCEGNIENLLDYSTVANGNHPTMDTNCYAYLFKGAMIVTPPKLQATTLTQSCYSNMFAGTYLIKAPVLPATSLASYCYDGMFRDSKLVYAPDLPATVLANYCYRNMFRMVSTLTAPPNLPATSLASNCYNSMFAYTGLKTAPELPATTLQNECYTFMFFGCTDLATLPELPATKLKYYCYQNMFNGCSKIKLSTTQTGDYQTEYRIPTSDTGTTADSALQNMFASTGGTFTGTPTINTTYYTSNTIIPATSAT